MSFADSLAALVRDIVGPLAYLQRHPAKVVSQASNGTVEVAPDNAAVPAQSSVPLVLGVPGIRVKLGPGTRVRLSYASGDPERPEVSLFEGDALLELELEATTRVVIKSPQVLLGGGGASQAFVLGTAYRAAEDTMLTALAAALTALAGTVPTPPGAGPMVATAPQAAAWAAAAAAINTFIEASASYLSTAVKGQ